MTIIERVQALSFHPDDYIVFGSGILDALDLRQASDIDLVVSPVLFAHLKEAGWTEYTKPNGDEFLVKGDTEAFLVWDNTSPEPNLAELKSEEIMIDGIPFCSPERLIGWKRRKNRPKDQTDVALLEKWLVVHSFSAPQ